MKNVRSDRLLSQAALPQPSKLVLALSFTLGLTLAGCANVNTKTADSSSAGPVIQAETAKPVVPPYKGGGYYKDDGPGANPPANLDDIPDAVPKAEPLHRYANNAYKVLGKRYVPLADNDDYKARGLASWYGRKFHGNATSIGEPYDMYAMSAAHPTLPLPSYARVTNIENGKSVVVRINDRGPFHPGRIIDLSYTAAHKLDVLKNVTEVEVEAVQAGEELAAAPTSFAAQAATDPAVAIPAPIAKTETAASNPGRTIYLQLGAFSNPLTADAVMAQVTAKLSKNFPGIMRLELGGFHKVHAGPFANLEQADQAAAALQQDLGIKAFKVITATAPPVADAALPVGPSGLYLQLAAVSSPSAADALAARVKNRFGNELPGLDQINMGALFKLQAGPFASSAAAERVAQAYQQDFGVKPYRVIR